MHSIEKMFDRIETLREQAREILQKNPDIVKERSINMNIINKTDRYDEHYDYQRRAIMLEVERQGEIPQLFLEHFEKRLDYVEQFMNENTIGTSVNIIHDLYRDILMCIK